jgi:peptidyl-dipeptidase A
MPRGLPSSILPAHLVIITLILGELLASQWQHYLVKSCPEISGSEEVSFLGDPRIGVYFKEQVFGPGTLYPWNEMIRRSTGEPLTPKYFAQQFVDGN